MNEIILKLHGGTFSLSVDAGGGSVSSNLHYGTLEEFLDVAGDDPDSPVSDQYSYGRYEGAIDALESIILAAAQAGIDVQGEQFATALQTTLDAIGNNL